MDLPPFVRAAEGGAEIDALVRPRARRAALWGIHGGALKVNVTAAPADGAANRAVEAFFASLVGVPRSRVRVARGRGSRHKRIAIDGTSPERVAEALLPHLE